MATVRAGGDEIVFGQHDQLVSPAPWTAIGIDRAGIHLRDISGRGQDGLNLGLGSGLAGGIVGIGRIVGGEQGERAERKQARSLIGHDMLEVFLQDGGGFGAVVGRGGTVGTHGLQGDLHRFGHAGAPADESEGGTVSHGCAALSVGLPTSRAARTTGVRVSAKRSLSRGVRSDRQHPSACRRHLL
jgi:hypothetical protein